MELTKNFDHKTAEEKWYRHWTEKNYFHSEPDEREPYTVVIPPPNVTGVLHMGHCLNNTIQDILVRRARMQGKNACWVPGTDHASIATEAKVVQMLRERGIQKSQLTREEFLQYAREWKEKYGGIILQQLRKLGCSCDWERTAYTMDDEYYASVINVFIDLYEKGLIYRGKRMINWDPKAKTALSDEEVIHKETQQKLYYLRYQLSDENGKPIPFSATANGGIVIATVRPETIMGDTAICVHPNDERYKHLHGKFAFIPLINRRIPIITDDYVTMEFGTGALKVTPAHDPNDYVLGQKHNLEVIDTLNEDGTLNELAQIYVGEDRFEARRKIVKELEEKNYIVKTEDYTSEVGYSERTDVVIEPRLSLQWWVSMRKLSEPALKAVADEAIKFYPVKFKNLYRYWMENIKDWCISRQLWWGHRIPAWYAPDGTFAVAATKEEAFKKLKSRNEKVKIEDIKQDEDVMDTWFSSWLWPFEVFHGLSRPGNTDIKYYYPTQTLVTAPEIIFFWVARMIMSGFEYMGEKPFSNVYFTGIVRDEQGRKMSKSLGNSPDLLALIDKYGADAVRFGIMISSPAGNDLLFDVKEESTLKQGSFFINKMWNALKLVKMWEGRQSTAGYEHATENFATEWFGNRLNEAKQELESLYKDFKLSEALKLLYSLIWDDFCSWYLEWVKPGFEQPIDANTYSKTIFFFEELLQLLHPYMPFVTEEMYHTLLKRREGNDLCIKQFKIIESPNKEILNRGEDLKNLLSKGRDYKKASDLKQSELIAKLTIPKQIFGDAISIYGIIEKQLNVQNIDKTDSGEFPATLATAIYPFKNTKVGFEIEQKIDHTKRKNELLKELEYQKGFLQTVLKKLSNERFVQNAKPEVVALEKKKQADAEARIQTIEESLKSL